MAETKKVKYVGGDVRILETQYGPPIRLEHDKVYELPAKVADDLLKRKHFTTATSAVTSTPSSKKAVKGGN